MQFHGEYQHRIDPQGRVAVPARFREHFGGRAVLTRGFDPCVWAYTREAWQDWSAAVAAMSPSRRQARVLRRATFGSAYELDLDRQGRVLLPQALRRYAALTDEVVFVGSGDYLELWDRRRWEEEILPAVEQAAASMDEDGEVAP